MGLVKDVGGLSGGLEEVDFGGKFKFVFVEVDDDLDTNLMLISSCSPMASSTAFSKPG